MKVLIPILVSFMAFIGPTVGQAASDVTKTDAANAPPDPATEACRTTGLLALKEQSPTIKNLIFDMETVLISKADTKIEDIPVHLVMMGEAYLERKETGKAYHFVCLIGEKGKVLLTFFMSPGS